MKKWFKLLKNQKGMTLVELLAVVVILGIVAAIAVPAVGNIIQNSKRDAHESNALLIINATKLGVVSGQLANVADADGTTPGTQYSLTSLVTAGLLDSIPSDPSVSNDTYDGSSYVTYIKNNNGSGTYSIKLSNGTHNYYNNDSEVSITGGTVHPNMPN